MRSHALLAALACAPLAIGCASSQTDEIQTIAPQDIAGTWTYRSSDGERLGGTIIIPNDTSLDSFALIAWESLPGMIEYPGALHALIHTGSYVSWTDPSRQVSGIELTVHEGRLHATYFDNCMGLVRWSKRSAQRSVRHCEHTVLTLRRVSPP